MGPNLLFLEITHTQNIFLKTKPKTPQIPHKNQNMILFMPETLIPAFYFLISFKFMKAHTHTAVKGNKDLQIILKTYV